MNNPESSENAEGKPHRRRVRYSGTHPKCFAEKYKEHAIEAHPDLREHLREKGKTPAGTHIPILVNEVMEILHPSAGDIVADCTLGYGGHAAEFIKRISPGGKLVGLDVDGIELQRTRIRLTELYPDVSMAFYRSNFAGIANAMKQESIDGFDIIFADLGLSSMQIDDPGRGMSFRQDGPLDMRMDDRRKQTAADVLNTLTEEALSDALWKLADEPDCQAIAQQIVRWRQREPFSRIMQLVELVFKAKGLTVAEYKRQQRQKPGGLHPAARTFQALRMRVNDELGVLKELLRVVPDCLRAGGRVGIISFHSGEDRLIKHNFADGLRNGLYQAIADEVITPTRAEIAANSRSASAKFRWAINAV
ncbi:MAG: 16S rRNA (cytosine(1402)-N(4))-methyltransferase RsmH [Planctomycetales bacterium]|nr:16S rRNA (cytosine(1402)-N(4))-methyltransferase RsmH [Planctomycetales bacterium]